MMDEEKTDTVDTLAIPQAEIIPAEISDSGEVISDDYAGIASKPVTAEQAAILQEPVNLIDIDILPTGEVYLSQVGYRRRLSAAFGPGGWGMRPLGRPTLSGNSLMQEWGMYANGVFVSSAYGEAEYQPDNARMTYATALEALKSNALMRCCKDLGIASECWDKRFCNKFIAEHCVKVFRKQAKKIPFQWRRKDSQPFYDEGQASTPTPEKKTDPEPSQAPGTSNVTVCEFIREVKTSTGPSEKYRIVLDGKEYTTVRKSVHLICTRAMARGEQVTVLEEEHDPKWGYDLKKVAIEGAE